MHFNIKYEPVAGLVTGPKQTNKQSFNAFWEAELASWLQYMIIKMGSQIRNPSMENFSPFYFPWE